jgi:hypothetical protein
MFIHFAYSCAQDDHNCVGYFTAAGLLYIIPSCSIEVTWILCILSTTYIITNKRVIQKQNIPVTESYTVVKNDSVRCAESEGGKWNVIFAEVNWTDSDGDHCKEFFALSNMKDITMVSSVLHSTAFKHEAPNPGRESQLCVDLESAFPPSLREFAASLLQSNRETLTQMWTFYPTKRQGNWISRCGLLSFTVVSILTGIPWAQGLNGWIPLTVLYFIVFCMIIQEIVVTIRLQMERRQAIFFLVSNMHVYRLSISSDGRGVVEGKLNPLDVDVIRVIEGPDGYGDLTVFPGEPDSEVHPVFKDVPSVCELYRIVRNLLAAQLAARPQRRDPRAFSS